MQTQQQVEADCEHFQSELTEIGCMGIGHYMCQECVNFVPTVLVRLAKNTYTPVRLPAPVKPNQKTQP